MKKLLVLILTVALVACVGMTAFAATVATPFDTDSALNIDMVQDFSNTSTISGSFLGIANSAQAVDSDAFTGSYALGADLTVLNEDQVWVGILDTAFAGANANAEGLGFYVKNTNADAATFNFYLVVSESGSLNDGAYTIGSSKNYALVTANGVTTSTAPEVYHPYDPTTLVQSTFTVPANFEGYVCVSLADLQKNWSSDMYSSDLAVTGLGVMNGGGLVFDNIFYYGANLTADTDAADLLADLPTDTADISVIAYAATAIVGLGALVVAKKR